MATTNRHRALAGKLMENTGTSIYQAMIAVGYAPATAKTPRQITQSKGFLQILEEAGVTDDRISRVIDEGLSADKAGEPDHNTRHKFLETAVKLKGHMSPEAAQAANTTYNTFIQNNGLDAAGPEAKELMEITLDTLMAQTQRKKVPNGQQG